jgi:hypothetical protein
MVLETLEVFHGIAGVWLKAKCLIISHIVILKNFFFDLNLLGGKWVREAQATQ